MFEKFRARRAAQAYQAAYNGWQQRRDGYAQLLQTAETFNGAPSADLMLAAGEAVFFQVAGAALVEERRSAGHWQGASQGVSIPIGSIGGRSVRYRVGANRGHFVQGAPARTAIDTGTLYVTNMRVIFQGANQTRECSFTKLIGVQHSDSEGYTTFSVSNRQKPITIQYGPALSATFDFRLDLALAHFQGSTGDLVAQLQNDLATIDAQRPAPPNPPAVSPPPVSAPPMAPPA